MPQSPLDALRGHARAAAPRSRTPHSGAPVGAALLLSDGAWIPGVRVESASFPLTIPALHGAYGAMRCAGRADVVAAALSRPFLPGEADAFADALDLDARPDGDDALVLGPEGTALPHPGDRLDVLADLPGSDIAGIKQARAVAERAHVPESDFPVGALLLDTRGRVVPGCNVEQTDWTRGLCAERVAVATAAAYGLGRPVKLFLTCLKAPGATPCGACRQVLVEQAPTLLLIVDQGGGPARHLGASDLLPHAFDGALLKA